MVEDADLTVYDMYVRCDVKQPKEEHHSLGKQPYCRESFYTKSSRASKNDKENHNGLAKTDCVHIVTYGFVQSLKSAVCSPRRSSSSLQGAPRLMPGATKTGGAHSIPHFLLLF
eukprot:scaffold38938_cov59-Attheya_sp.AAC.5